MKICCKCKLRKDSLEFHKDNTKWDGLRSYCKACSRDYGANHYKINKDKYRAASKRSNNKRMRWIRSIKEKTPCSDCGCYYPFWIMQFDHVRGEKKFQMSDIWAWIGKKGILEEMEKCELVCANCHAHRTYIRNLNPDLDESEYPWNRAG